MTKEEVVDLINDAGYCVLATVDDLKPKVRPMMPYLTDDGNFLLAVLSNCRTILQIGKNENVEMCFIDRKMRFARISGKANISNNLEKKLIVWENIPMLRQYFTGSDDKNLILIEIVPDKIEVRTPQNKEAEIIVFK